MDGDDTPAARTVAVAFMFVYSVDASVDGVRGELVRSHGCVAAFDLATFRLIFPIFGPFFPTCRQ